MVAGIGAWLKRNYDRIVAAAVLVVLLVSLIMLAIQAKEQRAEQRRFDHQLESLAPKHKTALPDDKTLFENALTALAAPFQVEAWSLSLLNPQLRVKCVNCERPIPYAASNCTFVACGAAQPGPEEKTLVDRNHNGIPDEWEEKYGLFSFDPEVINGDPDNDGFSSKEEFEWRTDPKDPNSHPPYLAKIRVAEIKPIPFRMIFKAVSKSGTNLIFQINLRSGGKTYFAKIGDKVEIFKLVAYDEKTSDGPTLTLDNHGKKIPLIKGHLVPRDDYEIKLESLLDNSSFSVRPDIDFEFKGAKYRVKMVDTANMRVLINDPSRNLDVTIDRKVPDAHPDAKAQPVGK